MTGRALTASIVALLLSTPAIADTASGMPTGKRQHKPVAAEQQESEAEQKATRVRKQMQELKNTSQDTEQAMNKAELTESLANKTDDKAKQEKRVPETLRHKDRTVEEKTDKSEAARAKKKQD